MHFSFWAPSSSYIFHPEPPQRESETSRGASTLSVGGDFLAISLVFLLFRVVTMSLVRVEGSGFRVQGSGFRVQGSGTGGLVSFLCLSLLCFAFFVPQILFMWDRCGANWHIYDSQVQVLGLAFS